MPPKSLLERRDLSVRREFPDSLDRVFRRDDRFERGEVLPAGAAEKGVLLLRALSYLFDGDAHAALEEMRAEGDREDAGEEGWLGKGS